MDTNAYTEEEFKKVLKTLFAEKKRVKELQKQLGEKGIQKKFQTKLADIHKLSVTEEYAALKTAYFEKENECLGLKEKIEKVRPALKKLIEELKAARKEIGLLKEEKAPAQDGELEKVQEQITALEKDLEHSEHEKQRLKSENERLGEETERLLEREGEAQTLREQLLELEEELKSEKQMRERFEEERQSFLEGLKEKERELERVKANEQKERLRFESERGRLVERLAEGLSQVQRQTEIIQNLREENNTFHREYEEGEKKLRICQQQIFDLKEKLRGFTEISKENTVLKRQLDEAQAQMQESDLDSVCAEKEKIIEKAYAKMREFSSRHGDMVEKLEVLSRQLEEKQHQLSHMQNVKLQYAQRDAEMRKAQQHLAKKVKETTLLRDLSERQKGQIAELEASLNKKKNDLEQLQNNLNLQQKHEEKLQLMAKDRAQAAETLAKEWQEKFLTLQQDWQEKKAQLQGFQKMREDYDQMAATVSSLKNILEKREEA